MQSQPSDPHIDITVRSHDEQDRRIVAQPLSDADAIGNPADTVRIDRALRASRLNAKCCSSLGWRIRRTVASRAFLASRNQRTLAAINAPGRYQRTGKICALITAS